MAGQRNTMSAPFVAECRALPIAARCRLPRGLDRCGGIRGRDALRPMPMDVSSRSCRPTTWPGKRRATLLSRAVAATRSRVGERVGQGLEAVAASAAGTSTRDQRTRWSDTQGEHEDTMRAVRRRRIRTEVRCAVVSTFSARLGDGPRVIGLFAASDESDGAMTEATTRPRRGPRELPGAAERKPCE